MAVAREPSSAPASRPALPRYDKLKPRRGHSGEVGANQRGRLSVAMIELVDDRGYQGVTVRGLTRRAGVSTRAFYEHFTNLEACFIYTYELLIGRAARRIVAQSEREADWHNAFVTLGREVAEEPQAARFTLVHAPEVGPAAFERMRRAWQKLGDAVEVCLAASRSEIAISPLLVQGIVAGVARVVRSRLLADREDELPALAAEMAEWVLCICDEAAAELGRSAERPAPPLPPRAVAAGADALARSAIEDDRTIILSAAARLGASEGYGELSVPRIRAAAGVSRRSFDAQFEDVKECFLAALELRAERAFSGATHQGAAMAQTWPGAVHCTLTALGAHIARDPSRARVVFVEVFAAGGEGLRWRESLIGAIGDYARSRAPAEQRPSALAAEASAAAVWAILHDHVGAGKTARLPLEAPTLSYLVLAPAIGGPAAVAAIRVQTASAAGSDPRSGASGRSYIR